jgi:hypothetical protein
VEAKAPEGAKKNNMKPRGTAMKQELANKQISSAIKLQSYTMHGHTGSHFRNKYSLSGDLVGNGAGKLGTVPDQT